jgi:hypothetical protein
MAKKVRESQPQAGTAPTSVSSNIGTLTKPAASENSAGGQPRLVFPGLMPQGAGVSIPPTTHAGQLIISASVGEINIMFGQTRLSPIVNDGVVTATPFVEWFMTVSLSAPVAQQLCDGLKQALDQYTAQFGPVPKAAPPPTAKKQ